VNPEFELGFKEGSLVKVFGEQMSDGYYIGEVGYINIKYLEVVSQWINFPLLCVFVFCFAFVVSVPDMPRGSSEQINVLTGHS
jgi:hypothetical protein